MSTPVHCLAGRDTNPRMRDDHLSAQLFRAPYSRRDVIYPNRSVVLSNIDVAVGKVAAIAEAKKPGERTVWLGHSAGARALCIYLRTDPDINPDDHVFVLTGNQERKYGGANVLGFLPAADYGGTGFPEDSPFRIYDVARQYAFPEDCPVERTSKAMANVYAELNPFKWFRPAFHSDYANVRINDPSNAVHIEGPTNNHHYILSPSAVMPSCIKPWWGPEREAREDAKIRAEVEQAYSRPYASSPVAGAHWTAPGAGVNAEGQAVRQAAVPVWDPWA